MASSPRVANKCHANKCHAHVCHVCGCPNVHLELVDKAGETFAVAVFDPETWAKFKAYVDAQLARDSIGRCEGHA